MAVRIYRDAQTQTLSGPFQTTDVKEVLKKLKSLDRRNIVKETKKLFPSPELVENLCDIILKYEDEKEEFKSRFDEYMKISEDRARVESHLLKMNEKLQKFRIALDKLQSLVFREKKKVNDMQTKYEKVNLYAEQCYARSRKLMDSCNNVKLRNEIIYLFKDPPMDLRISQRIMGIQAPHEGEIVIDDEQETIVKRFDDRSCLTAEEEELLRKKAHMAEVTLERERASLEEKLAAESRQYKISAAENEQKRLEDAEKIAYLSKKLRETEINLTEINLKLLNCQKNCNLEKHLGYVRTFLFQWCIKQTIDNLSEEETAKEALERLSEEFERASSMWKFLEDPRFLELLSQDDFDEVIQKIFSLVKKEDEKKKRDVLPLDSNATEAKRPISPQMPVTKTKEQKVRLPSSPHVRKEKVAVLSKQEKSPMHDRQFSSLFLDRNGTSPVQHSFSCPLISESSSHSRAQRSKSNLLYATHTKLVDRIKSSELAPAESFYDINSHGVPSMSGPPQHVSQSASTEDIFKERGLEPRVSSQRIEEKGGFPSRKTRSGTQLAKQFQQSSVRSKSTSNVFLGGKTDSVKDKHKDFFPPPSSAAVVTTVYPRGIPDMSERELLDQVPYQKGTKSIARIRQTGSATRVQPKASSRIDHYSQLAQETNSRTAASATMQKVKSTDLVKPLPKKSVSKQQVSRVTSVKSSIADYPLQYEPRRVSEEILPTQKDVHPITQDAPVPICQSKSTPDLDLIYTTASAVSGSGQRISSQSHLRKTPSYDHQMTIPKQILKDTGQSEAGIRSRPVVRDIQPSRPPELAKLQTDITKTSTEEVHPSSVETDTVFDQPKAKIQEIPVEPAICDAQEPSAVKAPFVYRHFSDPIISHDESTCKICTNKRSAMSVDGGLYSTLKKSPVIKHSKLESVPRIDKAPEVSHIVKPPASSTFSQVPVDQPGPAMKKPSFDSARATGSRRGLFEEISDAEDPLKHKPQSVHVDRDIQTSHTFQPSPSSISEGRPRTHGSFAETSDAKKASKHKTHTVSITNEETSSPLSLSSLPSNGIAVSIADIKTSSFIHSGNFVSRQYHRTQRKPEDRKVKSVRTPKTPIRISVSPPDFQRQASYPTSIHTSGLSDDDEDKENYMRSLPLSSSRPVKRASPSDHVNILHFVSHKQCEETIYGLKAELEQAIATKKDLQQQLFRHLRTHSSCFGSYKKLKEELEFEKAHREAYIEPFKKQNEHLIERIKVLEARLARSDQYKKYEIQGFKTDVRNLTKKYKKLEKDFMKSLLSTDSGEKSSQLLQAINTGTKHMLGATIEIKRLKVKLYQIESEMKNL